VYNFAAKKTIDSWMVALLQPCFYSIKSKILALFEIPNKTFSKFYSPSEHLAVDGVIVLFKGRVIFQKFIPKKQKTLALKFTKHVTRLFTRMIWHKQHSTKANLSRSVTMKQAKCRVWTANSVKWKDCSEVWSTCDVCVCACVRARVFVCVCVCARARAQ